MHYRKRTLMLSLLCCLFNFGNINGPIFLSLVLVAGIRHVETSHSNKLSQLYRGFFQKQEILVLSDKH